MEIPKFESLNIQSYFNQENPLFKQKNILLVDDEEFNLMALRIILDSVGLQNTKLIDANNGQEALDIIIEDATNNKF